MEGDPIAALLASALEACFHHLLYIRRLYPKDSFALTNFLGISFRANRHPQVVSYIEESVRVAVPAVLELCRQQETHSDTSNDTATPSTLEVSINISQSQSHCDQEISPFSYSFSSQSQEQQPKVLEKYIFCFPCSSVHGIQQKSFLLPQQQQQQKQQQQQQQQQQHIHLSVHQKQQLIQLERAMKNVLLTIHSLEHTLPRLSPSPKACTFTISVAEKLQGTTEDDIHRGRGSSSSGIFSKTMEDAMDTGKWFQPLLLQSASEQEERIRPLQSVSEDLMQMQLFLCTTSNRSDPV